jgi:small GTP-binding protein
MAVPRAEGHYDIRLAVLGASTVGKASLVRRFSEACFEPNSAHTQAVDFKRREMVRNERRLSVEIWDTVGQESFVGLGVRGLQNPGGNNCRAGTGLVFVYDITDRASFDLVESWLVQHHDEDGDAQVQRVLVGNKSDLDSHRKVARKCGEELASRFNLAFFETSAKTGNNVEEAFDHIVDLAVAQRYTFTVQGEKRNGLRGLKGRVRDHTSGWRARLAAVPGRKEVAAGGYGLLFAYGINKVARY